MLIKKIQAFTLRTNIFKKFAKLEKSFPQERFFQVEDKTGLMFTMQDKPGVLMEALKVFSKNGVNLTYINSRPSKFISQNSGKKIDFFIIVEFGPFRCFLRINYVY